MKKLALFTRYRLYSGVFSPASLFTGGTVGAWYDPSDVVLNWRTNLLTWTQEFNNAAWTKTSVTAANTTATTAPDGTLTANELVNTVNNAGNLIRNTSITTFSFSIYAKAGTQTIIGIGENTKYNQIGQFDLANGTATKVNTNSTGDCGVSIVSVGNGWFRCIVYGVVSSTASIVVYGGTSYLGGAWALGTNVYIWGAQLELGSTATTYQAITTPEQTYLLYDPQPVLFTDSAGTTPVTAVEQPVRLMLDKSQGLVLGSELVDTITDPANWTAFGSNTVAADGDALKVTYVNSVSGAFSYLSAAKGLSSNLTPGVWYKITGQAKVNTGSANIVVQTASSWTSQAITSTSYVEFTVYFLAATATGDYLNFSNFSTGEEIWIRAVSVKSLAGNHALAPNDASRPILRARYNLLTYSEQFDNTATWTSLSGTGSLVIAANTTETTDPVGGNTADKFTAGSTPSTAHGVYASFTYLATAYTFSVYAKAGTYSFFALDFANGGSQGAVFNLSNGTVGFSDTGVTASISAAGNGWYRCVITKTMAAGASFPEFYFTSSGTANTRIYTAAGTETAYFWGADLRTGSSAGTYQRIAAATDYATAGFLPYLYFVTDDSFSTNSINFSATDKMLVCAGVTKLSDAAYGAVVELSASSLGYNGSFGMFASQTSGANYQWRSTGNLASTTTTSNTFAAPITDVLSAVGDISADIATLRIDGAQVAQSTTDQGTGNFGNYPLYIGRRNNASLPFEGRIYGLIVAGKTLSASELSATEAWMAAKTGVTLLVPTFDYYTTAAGDFIILDNGDNVVSDTYYV